MRAFGQTADFIEELVAHAGPSDSESIVKGRTVPSSCVTVIHKFLADDMSLL